MVFVNIGEATTAFELYAARLMARWRKFDQPLYHGGADSSLFLWLECNWKLVVEKYCEAYHLPFIHPSLNTYSRLEYHYNIPDIAGFLRQGKTVYQPQINSDGRRFPRFLNLSEMWDKWAEYISRFPNVQLVVHHDH